MVAAQEKNIELIPLSKAMEELQVKSSAFYERLKFLEISATRKGRKAFLKPEEVGQLKSLGRHIDSKGTMEGFNKSSGLAVISDAKLAEIEEPIKETKSTADEQFQGILRDAKEHRAGVEIAKYAIAARLNVEDLDPDLIQQVESVRAATLPKSQSASATAGAILDQFMQGKI